VLDFEHSVNDIADFWVAKPQEDRMYVIEGLDGTFTVLYVRIHSSTPQLDPLGTFNLLDLAQRACFNHYDKNPVV